MENNLFGERRFIFVFLWVASTESDWRDRGTGLRLPVGPAGVGQARPPSGKKVGDDRKARLRRACSRATVLARNLDGNLALADYGIACLG
jgi:hypothetical protein